MVGHDIMTWEVTILLRKLTDQYLIVHLGGHYFLTEISIL